MMRHYLLYLIVCVLIFSTNKVVLAGNWREHFNKNLDSWTKREHQRERVTWQVKDGRLNIYTKPFCNGRLNIGRILSRETHYTLAFTAFTIDTPVLGAKLRIIDSKNANVGIFIGEQPEDRFVLNPLRGTYQFVDHTIGGPLDFPDKSPNFDFELNEIDIRADHGRFELFSKGKKIVDFKDENFIRISYLGIVVIPKNCNNDATVVLDDFTVHGPSIPSIGTLDVQPKSKAAVLWGTLKRR